MTPFAVILKGWQASGNYQGHYSDPKKAVVIDLILEQKNAREIHVVAILESGELVTAHQNDVHVPMPASLQHLLAEVELST